MFKNIISGISLAITLFSAVAVASIKDTSNWWELVMPWVITCLIASVVGIVINNLEFIQGYTYPTFVCLLAWMYEHNLCKTNFAKQSNYIYRKHNRSYRKLYEVTQYLYDRVMYSEI